MRKSSIGTAVTFRLGERLFLITAGHVLDGDFQVHLFAGEGAAIQAKVLSHHAHPDCWSTKHHADIGFVEIENLNQIAACDMEQLHIGHKIPHIPTNALLFIAGCPKTGYDTNARPPEIGTAVIAGYLKSGSESILEIEYDRSGHAISPDGSNFKESDFFETPEGFSGGGVWTLMQIKEGELFLPKNHIKMNGTQFQWNSKTRMLQAMRPRFSIPFFFEKYPELRKDYYHVLDGL